jgi:transposase
MSLLPDPSCLALEAVRSRGDGIVIAARTRAETAACPVCGHACTRVHSRYRRTLLDLPWQGMSVRFHLTVRKFRCLNPECPRRVFAERIPSVAACHGQKTTRLSGALLQLAWLAGGEAAARIARLLGLVLSPDSLLYRLKAAKQDQKPPLSAPRVLGVDDFAFRRGRVYGTILVDLEQRRPIDLLPDRETRTLEGWLRSHPGVEILCRDRSPAYTEAATKGAPHAVQVADRWHLVKNLAEGLTRFLDQHRSELCQAAPLLGSTEGNLPVAWPPTKGIATEEHYQQQRQRRQNRYQSVVALHEQGMSLRKISRTLALARGTVNRFVQADSFPEIARHQARPTSLDSFKPYLHRRWLQGCRNGQQLFREIKEQGFTGTCSWVSRYVTGLRRGMAEQIAVRSAKPPASRAVAALLLRRAEDLAGAERTFITHLRETCPSIGTVYDLGQRFLAMVRQRQKDMLPAGIEDAKASGVTVVAGFAQGLVQDLAAVEAALSLPWSNGQTEGQVNRLKLVKRSMYGRAGFDLLKARVLPLPA